MSERIDGIRIEIDDLGGLQSSADVLSGLTRVFSSFGDVRSISPLDSEGRPRVYLIDFFDEVHATTAANISGCSMFGFNTVIVDLRTPCAGVR